MDDPDEDGWTPEQAEALGRYEECVRRHGFIQEDYLEARHVQRSRSLDEQARALSTGEYWAARYAALEDEYFEAKKALAAAERALIRTGVSPE